MTAPTHPGDRPSLRTLASALAASGVLSALALFAAVSTAPDAVRAPLVWGGGTAAVVLCAAVTAAAHSGHAARDRRRRLESATRDIGRLLQQQAHASEETRREQQRFIDELAGQQAEFAAEQARVTEAGTAELDRLRRERNGLAEELERARRERATALASTSHTAARLQALATATLADLRAMEDRHTDEDVLANLLHLDHRTAQAGRLADSIAVLTGARSGRRWARPIGMESVLRGAMGRIAGYQRVRIHSVGEAAVAGHAAEGVMHALAELLDNAANFSPPTAEVHVYVEVVPAGVIVSVEDSGLVMGDVQLRRAERAVAGDVSELGGLTGTRLGLAVVGRLARKHGLKVSFRPSARGGTGVLMLIPQEILTGPAMPRPAAAATARPADPTAPSGPTTPADPAPVHEFPAPTADEGSDGPAGLPRRRRGRTLAEAERFRSAPRSAEQRPAPGTAEARVTRFHTFRKSVRPTTAPDHQSGPGQATPPRDAPPNTQPPASAHDTAPDNPSTASAHGTVPDTHTPASAHRTVPDSPSTASTHNTTPNNPSTPSARAHSTVPDNRSAGSLRGSASPAAAGRPATSARDTTPGDHTAAPPDNGPAAPPHHAAENAAEPEHGSPASSPSHSHAHPEGDATS
ncbi:ATP-binding protein [Streptomyces sp. NPDC005728]|uniref:sensor histidine kinase n=1 Tax=Streptomyces sp. NPDC005728 TaxID=3157054 RepID=UPI0033F98A71